MSARPPRLAQWLFRVLLHPSVRTHALGDVQEEFSELARSKGSAPARRWYWGQLVRAVVPSLVRRSADLRHMAGDRSELRRAGRVLLRRPGFTVASALTLGLGIGSATAIYRLVDSVLLRPLPYADSEKLVTVWNTYIDWRDDDILSAYWDHIELSWPEFERWRSAQTSFERVGIYAADPAVLTGDEGATVLPVGRTSASLFGLLGARPHLGRFFAEEEVGVGAPRLAIISFELWRDRFGSDPDIVSRTLTLDDAPFQIVGVLEQGFSLRILNSPAVLERRKDIWVPIGAHGGSLDEGTHNYEALGVLRDGMTLQGAFDETLALLRGPSPRRVRGARLLYRKDAESNSARRPLFLLSGAVALLLLIACANVAGLYLAEISRRDGELATRAALGAGWARLRTQLAFEGGLLGLLGGIVGLGVAQVTLRVLVAWAPAEFVLPADRNLGWSTVLVALTLSLGVGVLLSLPPALRIKRTDIAPVLRGIRSAGGRGARRLQTGLIGAQFAISLVLLVMGGLVVQSLGRSLSVDPGFAVEEILTGRLRLTPARYPSGEDVARFYHALAERLEAEPGVLAASVTSAMPFSGQAGSSSFRIVGREVAEGEKLPEAHRRTVRPGFVDLMNLRVLSGRSLDLSDRSFDAPVIVISESMAARYWPNGDALGSRISRDRRDFEIVGIVGDVIHADLRGEVLPTFYVPIDVAERRAGMTVAVRTSGPPVEFAGALRAAVAGIDADVPVERIETAVSLVANSTREERFRSLLLIAFAIAATLLSAIGLFGATVRRVSARARELGIRVALGAVRGGLIRGVAVREGRVIVFGIVVGLAASAWATSLIGPMLFEVSALDLITFVGAAVALGAVGIGSTVLAARRTILTNPADVIRTE